MSIRWLVTPVINNSYWEYNLKTEEWEYESPMPLEDYEPKFIWIPSRDHKDQALLLLSLGMSKEEIEQTLKESE